MGDLRNGFHFFWTSNANLGTKEKTESIPVTVPNLLQEILLAVRMRAGFVFVVFQVTCYLGEKKNTNMEEMEGNIYAGVSSELMLLCILDRQRQSALSYPGTWRSHGCPSALAGC